MLSQDELLRLLKRVASPQPASFFESQVLEFKQPKRTVKETLTLLADAAVCFANADGGTLVFGVNDKATKREEAFVGLKDDYAVDVIRRGIFDRTSPSITTIAYEVEQEDQRVIAINVPAGVLPHSNSAGLATRRLGKECRPFSPAEQREVQMARGYLDWSAESSGLPLSAVSEVELGRCRALLANAGSEELAELRTRNLLEALNLIHADRTLTNAAVLVLTAEDDLAAAVETYGYSYQFRATAGTEASTRFRQARPILAAVEGLLDAVERRVEVRPLNLAGGAQMQLVDYPMDALRELVVNAFIHRSYETPGTVDIEHTPERLSVTSPGGLVAGVTPANILTAPSTPRHRLLAEVITRMRVAERTGQGIDRAYREMLRAGKEPPLFEDTGLTARALLAGGIGNDAFVRFVSELPADLGSDVEVLLALGLLRTRQTIEARRLAQAIQRTAVEAQDVLERLASEDVRILEPTRGTARRRLPSYRFRSDPLAALARAVDYHRRTVDQTDAKVIEHVKEYGFVTNRTLQRMFDVNVPTARNMLTDLQTRGLLKKIGTARGGPGVRYGPGPTSKSIKSS
jgi:ATP-dependent DNA helicase RecG